MGGGHPGARSLGSPPTSFHLQPIVRLKRLQIPPRPGAAVRDRPSHQTSQILAMSLVSAIRHPLCPACSVLSLQLVRGPSSRPAPVILERRKSNPAFWLHQPVHTDS